MNVFLLTSIAFLVVAVFFCLLVGLCYGLLKYLFRSTAVTVNPCARAGKEPVSVGRGARVSATQFTPRYFRQEFADVEMPD